MVPVNSISSYYSSKSNIRVNPDEAKLEVNLSCPVCGDEEVTADITFPSGIRSLFVISDIFRELL